MKLFQHTGTAETDLQQRLTRDLHDAYTELLSAQCATDRLRRNHRTEAIAKGEPEKLKTLLITAKALCEYYTKLGKTVGK